MNMPPLASETVVVEETKHNLFRDLLILSKPRISVMVLLTVAVAGLISAPPEARLVPLLHAMFGLLLVSASGCAINQYLERYVDWLMPRTAKRPLPDQRLTATQVAVFGAVTLGVGLTWLVTLVNWQSAVVAAATWIVYVAIYTPLKPRTWLNTFVGAVAGALPVLIGSTAMVDGQLTVAAWLLFAVLYIWQFPHFMAIAWLYREDYLAGKLRMASTESDSRALTGRVATLFAVILIPLTALAMWPATAWQVVMLVLTLLLGFWYLAAARQFQKQVGDIRARRLFRVSLLYLPGYLTLLSLATALPGPSPGLAVAIFTGGSG